MAVGSHAQLCSLWIGNRLSYIEHLSFASMLFHGHSVALYTYSSISNVPPGVEIRDAREILPEELIIYHRGTGSPALFSDHFRYEIQRLNAGIWVDADIILLKPLPDREYLFGMTNDRIVNGAIFRAPADSELIKNLIHFARSPYSNPPWLPLGKRFCQSLRTFAGCPIKSEDMPWGIIGPKAISYLVKKHKLKDEVLPKKMFYPIDYKNADWFFDPKVDVNASLIDETIAVHLWNKKIAAYKSTPPPVGSFIDKQCHLLDVDANLHTIH